MSTDADAAERELSYQNAVLLLDEFEEALDDLAAEDETSPEQQEQAGDLLHRLLSSLDDLPLSSELARERLDNVESWAEVLIEEEDPDEAAGPGSVRTLLLDELAELRGLLEYEMTT